MFDLLERERDKEIQIEIQGREIERKKEIEIERDTEGREGEREQALHCDLPGFLHQFHCRTFR